MGDAAFHRIAADPGHDAPLGARVDALNRYLFNELGFSGNRDQYEDPRNSCLNEVLDRRTGIPITLALVYIEVARRAGVRAEGVNFPGHFLVRALQDLHTDDPGEGLIVDRVPRRRDSQRAGLPAAAPPAIGEEAAWEPAAARTRDAAADPRAHAAQSEAALRAAGARFRRRALVAGSAAGARRRTRSPSCATAGCSRIT